MLLTPRIIRTHEYTARDLSPIYVGTNQNFGLTGPPPLIAPPPVEPEAAPARATAPGAAARRQQCLRRELPSSRQRQPDGTPGQVTPPATTTAESGCSRSSSRRAAARSHCAAGNRVWRRTAQISVTPPAGDIRVRRGSVYRADLRQQRVASHHRHADRDL